MRKIYVHQNALRLKFYTGSDLRGNVHCEIRYRKPDRTKGKLTAGILDAENGIVAYDVMDRNELDKPGYWIFWVWVQYEDGREATGSEVCIFVYDDPWEDRE